MSAESTSDGSDTEWESDWEIGWPSDADLDSIDITTTVHSSQAPGSHARRYELKKRKIEAKKTHSAFVVYENERLLMRISRLVEGFDRFPNEILLEIYKYLEPIDLLRLEEVNRRSEGLLETRSMDVDVAWGCARANSRDMPGPFPGMSEQTWANLNFVFMCDFCHIHPVRDIDKYVKLELQCRICEYCIDTHSYTIDELGALRHVAESCGWWKYTLDDRLDVYFVPVIGKWYLYNSPSPTRARIVYRNLVLWNDVFELKKRLLAVPGHERARTLRNYKDEKNALVAHAHRTRLWKDEYIRDQELALQEIIETNLIERGYERELEWTALPHQVRHIPDEVIDNSMYYYRRGMIPSYGRICWERVAKRTMLLAKDARKRIDDLIAMEARASQMVE
ncbi:hypothetical protein CYLTODRAFT_427068 [Cylindrobasidium torrendii FP15055 ss-10]|uniref:F-box domain-containing protein n=1 Tax=Cylindrobasidium torrendii FP15055 ss-10 TaxID=1314674 RepID=A0A0D7AY97_9AGAR|nr:hypothetical protein CYLTODRAFT_427068 [Cylindrobasidium torrendii FP15055 ss-10]